MRRKPTKRGKPRSTDPLSEVVRFRLRRADKALLERAAQAAHLKTSEYARSAILMSARETLRSAQRLVTS